MTLVCIGSVVFCGLMSWSLRLSLEGGFIVPFGLFQCIDVLLVLNLLEMGESVSRGCGAGASFLVLLGVWWIIMEWFD